MDIKMEWSRDERFGDRWKVKITTDGNERTIQTMSSNLALAMMAIATHHMDTDAANPAEKAILDTAKEAIKTGASAVRGDGSQ